MNRILTILATFTFYHSRLPTINSFSPSSSTLRILIDTTTVDDIPDHSDMDVDAVITTMKQLINSPPSPADKYFLQIQNENELSHAPFSLSKSVQGFYIPFTNVSSYLENRNHYQGKFIWAIDTTITSVGNLIQAMENDIICICGDASFATFVARTMVPSQGQWIWYPMKSTLKFSRYIPPDVEVWRLRSSGMLGVVLPWDLLQSVEQHERKILFRRMRRPCSAVDYPPVIYLVGEDEEGSE